MDDRAELLAGTNPKDADSVFKIVSADVLPFGDTMILSWSSVSNKQYSVWGSTNLPAGFRLLRNNVPATPPINSYTDALSGLDHKFYRLQVQP